MKSAIWRMKHIADADEALDAAETLLAEARKSVERLQVDNKVILADGLIALARAHYRAVEVDILTKNA